MLSFEALFSYMTLTSIILLLLLTPTPQPDYSLQSYNLLLDIITILEKSSAIEEIITNAPNPNVKNKLDEVTQLSGFCLTIESSYINVSGCHNPSPEIYSESAIIITKEQTPLTIRFSLQKEKF
ncbi:MAG: hypothetical protein QXW70_01855 [Candidatus Anstonellales archaeon]